MLLWLFGVLLLPLDCNLYGNSFLLDKGDLCRTYAFFFPRVWTPCGHGAQVIVEGREEQSDGGEKNKDNKTNQNQTNHSPQAASPPSCSLS